ncbi:MAG TPA: hypothetical protein VF404_10485 [Sphingomonas sp.]
MAVVSALVFVGALALIAFVIAVTLVPALPRIIAVLAGEEEQPEPRLVLARRARIAVRPHPAATRLAVRLREAA